MNKTTDYDELKRLLDEVTELPWCEEWLYGALRHIWKNVGFEMFMGYEWKPDGHNLPTKEDAKAICDIINALPATLADVERLEEALYQIVSHLSPGLEGTSMSMIPKNIVTSVKQIVRDEHKGEAERDRQAKEIERLTANRDHCAAMAGERLRLASIATEREQEAKTEIERLRGLVDVLMERHDGGGPVEWKNGERTGFGPRCEADVDKTIEAAKAELDGEKTDD